VRHTKCGNKIGLEHLMLREDEAGKKKILPTVYEAPEPTLLLWKNYHYTDCDRGCRSFCAWTAFLVIILGAFYLVNYVF
jgi:hypothetical protein